MKHTFKVGERVAAYDETRLIAWVRRVTPTLVFVTFNKYATDEYPYHPKQLRRLKSKKKKAPREFWLNIYLNSMAGHISKSKADAHAAGGLLESVHVKEVLNRPKKPGVRITREVLARAWMLHVCGELPQGQYHGDKSEYFERFCKFLGLANEGDK